MGRRRRRMTRRMVTLSIYYAQGSVPHAFHASAV